MAFAVNEFETIYKRNFGKALGFARRLLYDPEEARDVVQQAFVNLWEATEPISNPDAFVMRSVRNACLNRIKATSNHDRIKNLYAIEIDNYDDNIDQQIDEIQQAFDLLSEPQRRVVDRIFTQGDTYREAANNLDVSVSTINKHIVNALKTLRKHFNTHRS